MLYVTRQMPVRGYPHRSRSNASSQPPPPRSAAGGLAGRDKQRNSGHDKEDRDAQDVHQSMPCALSANAQPSKWPKPRPLPWHTLSSHPNTNLSPPTSTPAASPTLSLPTAIPNPRPTPALPHPPRSFNLIVTVRVHQHGERRIIRNGHGVRWHRHCRLRCQPVWIDSPSQY